MLYESYDTNRPSMSSTPLTWRATSALHCALAAQRVKVNAYRLLEQWLSSGSNLWAGDQLPFEYTSSGVKIVHAGGWDSDAKRQEIRLILAQYGTICWRSLTAVLATLGLGEGDVQELVDGAVRELKDPRTTYALKFHHVFARKTRMSRIGSGDLLQACG